MALIKCKECGNEVSSKAKSCPKCGISFTKKKNGCLQYLVLIFFIILAIGVINSKNQDYQPIAYSNYNQQKDTPTINIGWSYSHIDDEMSGKKTNIASVYSTNAVQFKFPYNGEQHASLKLRTHPRHGKDVMLSIEKGQILCYSSDECNVLVKFDDKEPIKFSALAPEDNSRDLIFIQNYNSFFEKMLSSKKVLISTKIYEEGAPTFTFDVSGFQKDQYLPKK